MAVHIVGAVRTPLGKLLGRLSRIPAPDLGALAIREAIRQADIDPAEVKEVHLGCALQAGLGPNPARQAAHAAGLPADCFCVTLDRFSAALLTARAAILSGNADIVIAGGMDSPSLAPYLLPEAREGKRLGNARLVDPLDDLPTVPDRETENWRGKIVPVEVEEKDGSRSLMEEDEISDAGPADGATAQLMMSEAALKRTGATSLAHFVKTSGRRPTDAG